jgi:hypothetical protein
MQRAAARRVEDFIAARASVDARFRRVGQPLQELAHGLVIPEFA